MFELSGSPYGQGHSDGYEGNWCMPGKCRPQNRANFGAYEAGYEQGQLDKLRETNPIRFHMEQMKETPHEGLE